MIKISSSRIDINTNRNCDERYLSSNVTKYILLVEIEYQNWNEVYTILLHIN